MQALWSRAGQAHRCGCRVCESVVSSLGRRVTTAARPRKVTFVDIFTACYSSMLATAAIVDAVRKEDRRQEMDRQLEETRRELAQLQIRNLEASQTTSSTGSTQNEVTLPQMDQLWGAIKSLYTNRPYMKEIYNPATIRIDEFLNKIHTEQYECPDEATRNALRRTDYNHLEECIIREETDAAIRQRTPLNPNQLHNAGRTLSHLVQQLLKRADAHDKSNSPSPSFDEAIQLANEKTSFRYLVENDPERVIRNRIDLNSRLRKVVGSTLSLKEKVGRVCYNLMVSAYPADMHTYNTLIVAFDKHGYKYLSEPVVNSFYYYRRLRPTPSTFVAILNHYKTSGNYGRFLRSLASLAGLDGETGAKLRRRLADETSSERRKSSKIQTWTQTGDYFWEHAPLDKPLVEAAIQGLLHMKLFDQAAEFFVSCMKAKVVLGTHVIRQLFDECIVALDWRSAVRLIQGFTDCSSTWPSMLLGRDQDTSYLIGRIRVLLDLAGLRSVSGEVPRSTLDNLSISSHNFYQFLRDLTTADSTSQIEMPEPSAQTRDSALDPVSASKRRLLQIEALWKEQDSVGKMTRSIESKLLYPEFSSAFRMSMAFHIGNAVADQTVELNGEMMEIMSQLPLSERVERGFAECKTFQNSSNSRAEGGNIVEEMQELSRDIPAEEQDKEEVGMLLREEELDMLSAQNAITFKRMKANAAERKPLRARPMRLTAWPVADQQVGYLQNASFG
ncbi:pentatricopeptide repeat domain protein [Fusarium beomiforme]|uniref:Pentatricopeptide repeat domain protein n=1 Tax=Fusarium beomiforme TaxID=44412 RepID=A0A9P5E315_9HYPO|nr:pentatricopeptide repeat domain protein [Fusarium beomiforme]